MGVATIYIRNKYTTRIKSFSQVATKPRALIYLFVGTNEDLNNLSNLGSFHVHSGIQLRF